MRNLIDFLIRYSNALLFTFLFVLAVIMLASNGRFHSSVWFTSANVVSSKVYGLSNGISGYFNLKSINSSLQQSNAQLENEVLNLRSEIAFLKTQLQDTGTSILPRRFDYVLGTVLNNNTKSPRNYFTIDKGEEEGVKPGMGVVDQNGIVGIVNVAGKHSARVISVLNATQHISVRLKNTDIVGSLVWKINDPRYAYMEEIPRHSSFSKGDTVVTSGYSTTFPAGIPVGIVVGPVKTEGNNFHVLKIKLAGDFNKLSTVRVLKDAYKDEMDSLVRYDITSD